MRDIVDWGNVLLTSYSESFHDDSMSTKEMDGRFLIIMIVVVWGILIVGGILAYLLL